MTDRQFTDAFESCELPAKDFAHRDHVRLAWIYLRDHGYAEARSKIAESIQRFAAHNGVADKYHETITIAWLNLIQARMQSLPGTATFDDLIATFPGLLQKSALASYYSSGVLASDAARRQFIEPDLKPLSAAECANGSIAK